jgi:hypothetical protein
MKKLAYLLIVAVLMSSTAIAQEIPAGIRYIYASDELNARALKKLQTVFSRKTLKLDALLGPKVICGPQPWHTLKKETPLKGMKIAPAQIIVPLRSGGTREYEGALFQTKDEINAFARGMENYLASGGPYTIRKPDANELRIYWAIIPYDISEPIFVADNGEHKLLLHFLEDGETVFWIGDLAGMKLDE